MRATSLLPASSPFFRALFVAVYRRLFLLAWIIPASWIIYDARGPGIGAGFSRFIIAWLLLFFMMFILLAFERLFGTNAAENPEREIDEEEGGRLMYCGIATLPFSVLFPTLALKFLFFCTFYYMTRTVVAAWIRSTGRGTGKIPDPIGVPLQLMMDGWEEASRISREREMAAPPKPAPVPSPQLRRKVNCSWCDNTGRVKREPPCPVCEGTGMERAAFIALLSCPACKGERQMLCPRCRGQCLVQELA